MLLLLLACTQPDKKPDHNKTEVETTDSSGTTVTGPAADCVALGFPSRPFEDVAASSIIHEKAADITLQTTTGPWNLKENWSGCDSYLFIPDNPDQNRGVPYETWSNARDNASLIDQLPMNAHVFFLASLRSPDDRQAELDALQETIDKQLAKYDEETRAWRERHIHYVTDLSTQADSWLGDTFISPNWGTAIDRFQKLRYIGSMADPNRYDANLQWFDSNISMVANESVYYNYEADREEKLEAEDATVVQVWDNEYIAGSADMDVTLPDAATMATFDKLELDMQMFCQGDGEFGECPAWDYLDYLFLCDKENPENCSTELGRYITTYHREGRWLTDVSPLLALLKDGGTRRLRFASSNPYETTLSLRFSKTGASEKPSEAQVIYTGSGVGATYNDREALSITIPSDVKKVVLGVVMSGHGNPGCMEFCGTEHTFSINGHDNPFTYELGDHSFGCMNQITEGTVPNQYGTWWYGRNGWCPGRQVDLKTVDVTDQVLLGQANTINYALTNLDGTLESGGNIVLNTWLVYYR